MTYTLQKFDYGMHFIVPDEKLVSSFAKKGTKRVVCTLNGKVQIHCAFNSRKEGGHYVIISSKICKQLSLKQGDKLTANFTSDDSDYQFSMPEELQEVLATDDQASKIFHSLTPGKQRGLITLVLQVTSTGKRIERALKIAERLKAGVSSPQVILKNDSR